MERKIHAKSKRGMTVCVRAISVNHYKDLIVTKDFSKVNCRQCIAHLSPIDKTRVIKA